MSKDEPIVLVIMVAEDNLDDAALLTRAIGHISSHSKIIKTVTRQQALDTVTNEHPDFIFLDLKLPGTIDSEIVIDVRSISVEPVIIVTTGNRDMRQIDRCIEAGADDYIFKGHEYINPENIERSMNVARQCREKYVLNPLREKLKSIEESQTQNQAQFADLRVGYDRLKTYYDRLKQGVQSGRA